MSDRDAKLKIGVDASEMEPAAEKTKAFRQELEKVGTAGSDSSGDLQKAAGAIQAVESAEEGATEASRETASALGEVGQAASFAAETAVSGATASAQALEGVTRGAHEEAAALRGAGDAAAQSGAETTAALAAVTAAEEAAADGARELGRETEKAAEEAKWFRDGVREIEAMSTALRESGLAYEVQKQGLEAFERELEDAVAAQIKLGTAGKDGANAAGEALVGVRAKLADVNAKLKEQVDDARAAGKAGVEAGQEIADTQGVVAQRLALVEAAVLAAEKQYAKTSQVSKAALKEVIDTQTALTVAIEQTNGTNAAATAGQVARIDQLASRQAKLNEIVNRATNANKDNTIALQEEEQQIAGVANAAQNLISVFDMQQVTTTALVGKTGSLAMSYGQLKDTIKVMDLNTLSAVGSSAKLTSQAGLLALALAGGAAAGLKMSESNEQNAETMDSLWKAIKRVAEQTKTTTVDSLSGWQAALREVYINLLTVRANAVDLNATEAQSKRATDDLSHSLNELAIALVKGESGRKLYNIALRDGLDAEEAHALAMQDSADVMKFYEASRKAGTAGQKLWAQALRETNGDAAAMAKFIALNTEHMQHLTAETEKQTAAQKENNVHLAYAIDLARVKGDTDNRLLSAEEQARYRLSTARRQEEEAQNGLTQSLREGLAEIQKLIPASDLNSGALRDMSDATRDVLDSTKNLTASERERIAIALELATNGNTLTTAQREYAIALIDVILQQDKATAAATTLARIQSTLDQATNGTTAKLRTNVDVIAILTKSWDTNSVAISRAVSELANNIAATDGLTEAQRKLYEQVLDGIKKVDALTKSQRDLKEEQSKLLDVIAGGTKAQVDAAYAVYAANQKQIYSIQGQIEATQGLTKVNVENLRTNAQVVISTNELVKVGNTWTNIGTEQKKTTATTEAAGAAAQKSADQVGSAATKIEGAAGNIKDLGTAAADATQHLGGIGPAVNDAASELSESSKEWVEQTRLLQSVAEKVERLERLFVRTADAMDRVTESADKMAPALERAGDSASKAAGGAISYNNVTEN